MSAMLFALADYVQYRLQRGRYGRARLAAAGWKLAVPANFTGDQRPQPTDTFLLHPRLSSLSWFVMYVTDFLGSHTGLFGDNGMVIDATTDGVIEHPFADYLDGQSYILHLATSRSYTPAGRRDILEWSRSQMRTPYGWATAAFIGGQMVFGARHLPTDQPHPRLWLDVILLLVIASTPRLFNPSWPNLLLVLGVPYLAVLLLSRVRERLTRSARRARMDHYERQRRRFYARVEPAQLTAAEQSGLSVAGIDDKGIADGSLGRFLTDGIPEGWRDSRVLALTADNQAAASRQVAEALGRAEPPDGFELSLVPPEPPLLYLLRHPDEMARVLSEAAADDLRRPA